MAEIDFELSGIELWIKSAFLVPPDPAPPEGSRESIQIFRPGRNYYTFRLIVWFLIHLLIFTILGIFALLISRALPRMPEWARILTMGGEALAGTVFVATLIFTFISQRLNYLLCWYVVTDRSLRIRSGVLFVQELTMTYSNIQEIRVSAGPLQNLLKLADVEVQSAGGGGDAKPGNHSGRFRGLSNANAIRDLLVERLRQYRDSGLGETTTHSHVEPEAALAAARAVLDETRALRHALATLKT